MKADSKFLINIRYVDESVNQYSMTREYELRSPMEIKITHLQELVNQFIEQKIDAKTSSNLDDLLIKTSDGWKDAFALFGDKQQAQLHLSKLSDNYRLDLQLQKNQEQSSLSTIKKWENEIGECNAEEKQIRCQLKEKEKNLQVQNKSLIDLAFFYAEPLVYIREKRQCSTRKEVSFQKETALFIKTLLNKGVLRDTNIEISVGTESNIKRILAKGIKILHFSCHGMKQEEIGCLLLEDEKIGFQQKFSVKELIVLLKDNLPNLIVFNACHSNKLAEKIFEYFDSLGKKISTIGYKDKANDEQCTRFATNFYYEVFKGSSIKKAFEEAKREMSLNFDRIVLFSNQDLKIKPSSIGLNCQGYLAIENQHQPMEEDLFSINLELYTFIRDNFSQLNKQLIFFKGKQRMGKSLFVKKVCLYLKQREKIDRHLIIDFRDNATLKSSIDSVAAFRIQYEERIKKFIEQSKLKNIVLVFDHCDQLLKLQPREFLNLVSRFLKKICGKIILVFQNNINIEELKAKTYQKQDFFMKEVNQLHDFIVYKSKDWSYSLENMKMNAIEKVWKQIKNKVYEPHIHIKALKKGILAKSLEVYREELEILKEQERKNNEKGKDNSLILFKKIDQFINQLEKDIQYAFRMKTCGITLVDFTIIDFFVNINLEEQDFASLPQMTLQRTTSSQQSTTTQDDFLHNLEMLWQIKEIKKLPDNETIKKVLKIIQLLINYKYIKSKDHFATEHKHIKNFVQLLHKCLGLCLFLQNKMNKEQRKEKIKQSCRVLTQKIFIYLIMTTIRKGSWNYSQKREKIYQQSLQEIINEEQQMLILKMLEVYKSIVLNSDPDQFEDINPLNPVYTLTKIQQFQQKFLQFESKSFDSKELFYSQREISQLSLVLIKLVKGYLQSKNNVLSFQQAKKIKKIIEPCDGILNSKSFLYSPLASVKSHKQAYIFLIFTIQKIILNSPKNMKKQKRVEIISRFNKWIEVCKSEEFKELNQLIERYKAQSFNSCVALTSFPLAYEDHHDQKKKKHLNGYQTEIWKNKLVLINPSRFSLQIDEILSKSFQKLQKTIFTRVDCFSEQVIKKYKSDNLPILISFFFVDCKSTEQKHCYLYLQTQSGISKPLNISDLDFFPSYITIFCGAHVHKIREYLLEQKRINTIFIFIDSAPNSTGDNPDIFYFEIYKSIRNRIILMQIFRGFCDQFFETMFKSNSENFLEQITMAIQISKQNARMYAKSKFGNPFFEIIDDIIERIQTMNTENTQKQIEPPLKISQNSKKFNEQKSQTYYDFGFNEQLLKILAIFQKFKEKQGLKFIIVILDQKKKKDSKKMFISCLKSKVKKLALFPNGLKIQNQPEQKNTASSNVQQIQQTSNLGDVLEIYEQKNADFIREKIEQQKNAQALFSISMNKVILFTTNTTVFSKYELKDEQFLQQFYLDMSMEYNILVNSFQYLIQQYSSKIKNFSYREKEIILKLADQINKHKNSSKSLDLIIRYIQHLK